MPDLFQKPSPHASTHEQGGADEITAQNLGSDGAVADKIMKTDGSGGWTLVDIPTGGPGGTDEKAKVSSDDTTTGYLEDKVVAGSGIVLATLNGAGDEDLQISLGTHASTHLDGGSDEITAQDLGSGAAVVDKIMKTDGSGGWVLQDAPGAAFGASLFTSESEPISGTTSGTFQQKLTMSVTSLPLGDYILAYQLLLTGTANNTQIEARVQLDDSTDIVTQTARLTIANGAYLSAGHKAFFTFSGNHFFDVDWRKSAGSGTAQVQWVRMAFWRIA